ncbi:MAG: type II toxin-antitoxin system prevent-host-death family antitoxin [Candidatus Eremiobacteraeota bacterium]|nr:type II toxin-antitoxin system prevent-host-death family antitoxin [Candidatus Eremiobacteraeota bacterium]
MKTVGIFEGKTHFSALIEEAHNGQTIVVTKNGKPVAQISPLHDTTAGDSAAEAMDRILSSTARLNGVTIRELIDEGRRY